MARDYRIARRHFLKLSAMAAAGTVVAACAGGGTSGNKTGGQGASGSQTGPAQASGKFAEAPELAALVKAGKLDPIEKRIPTNPYVVPHKWLTKGKYGGQLSMAYKRTEGSEQYIQESMYGNSPLRYLKDAMEIGPGLAESWEGNKDLSQWTLHFRKGLRWSDGQPFTVDDILFWWEDEILNTDFAQTIPDDMKSGKDTVGKMEKVDDTTLRLVFDAPAPAAPERIAAWVNRGIGPRWGDPKHYLMQFHPKYNLDVTKKSDWLITYQQMWDITVNPACPTLTGWRMSEINPGQSSTWVRNPYYYCVDRWNQQLPYINTIKVTNYQDQEALKLAYTQGKVDYVHGGHAPIAPNDYATLKAGETTGDYKMWFWDSGSGTGSMFFFNHDHPDDEIRTLIRNPNFKRALSYAFDRSTVRKLLYYDTGEETTGTLSPKGKNFQVGKGPQIYKQWRDSYIAYDPGKAKKMLDDLGLKDVTGDGFRDLPSGRKLEITLDFHSDASTEHITKNDLLAKNWNSVGIKTTPNPVPTTSFNTQWAAAQLMSYTDWEVGDNAPLIYPGWVIPVENSHWAPLHGTWWGFRGTATLQNELDVSPWKRNPPRMGPQDKAFFPVVQQLWDLYNKARLEPDEMKRNSYMWEVFKLHIDQGPMFLGTTANWLRAVIAKNGLKNVAKREDLTLHGWVNPWIHPTPAAYDFEAYFWDNPAQHGG